MTIKEKLEAAGWYRVSYRKYGMIIRAKWHDRVTGLIYSQGEAWRIQRERNLNKKLSRMARKEG